VYKGISDKTKVNELAKIFRKLYPDLSHKELVHKLKCSNLILKESLSASASDKLKTIIENNGGLCEIVDTQNDDFIDLSQIIDDAEASVQKNKIESKVAVKIAGKVTKVLGTETIEGFSLKNLFSEVFKKRSQEEIESYYMVGTIHTTPKIQDVSIEWPRPWLFIRMFSLMFLIYLGFLFGMDIWQNQNLVPGLIFAGSFAMPISILMFFFEMNSPRNVSLVVVLKMMMMGGILSLLFSLFIFDLTTPLGWMGAPLAGLVEEPGKLIALLFIAKAKKYPFIHNGVLLGAAVGTGFAAFESMGYAYRFLLEYGYDDMLGTISIRGVLSPFCHIVWTAMIGGALWRVKQGREFQSKMLLDIRFQKVFWLTALQHMIWNSSLELPFMGKYLILGVVSWIVILSLLQEGLNEINKHKKHIGLSD